MNALAYEICFKLEETKSFQVAISGEHIRRAAENLILRRDTHVHQLTDKLKEERVKRVIEPILLSTNIPGSIDEDDMLYVQDLGLISMEGGMRIANRLYAEVIPRALTFTTQHTISEETRWYIDEDGLLDMGKLLESFQDFFREHFEGWSAGVQYREVSMQLLLQAFLQRIINSGGYLFREYGLGRMRTDLLIRWPQSESKQKIVLELKLRYGALDSLIEKGLSQTAEYMDKCGATEGHLVIFDRRDSIPWEERIFRSSGSSGGYEIGIWGM